MSVNRYSRPQTHYWVCLLKDVSVFLHLFHIYYLFKPGIHYLDTGMIYTSISKLEGISWSSGDIWFLGQTQIIGFIHLMTALQIMAPSLIVYFIFTYRLDLEIFKGESKDFCSKNDENMIKVIKIKKYLSVDYDKNINYSCLYTCS